MSHHIIDFLFSIDYMLVLNSWRFMYQEVENDILMLQSSQQGTFFFEELEFIQF